jgi:hypothetical protein
VASIAEVVDVTIPAAADDRAHAAVATVRTETIEAMAGIARDMSRIGKQMRAVESTVAAKVAQAGRTTEESIRQALVPVKADRACF